MSFTDKKNESEGKYSSNHEEVYYCTGCGTKLTKYDERCPNCERKNPHYIYK